MRKIYLFIGLMLSWLSFSQGGPGGSCATITSFCGDASLPFNNVTNTPNLGNIGCLGTAPNGAWYTFQVSTPGLLDFQISQTNAAGTGIDVDFICWGPFTSDPRLNASLCTTALQDYPDGQNAGAGNIVACSYSAAPVENFSIPNAIAGNFYVVLITNYSNQSGTITFDQTNITGGTNGSTNCEICGVTLGPDRFICNAAVTSVTLTANFYSPPVTPGTLNYRWYLGGVLQTTTTTNTLVVNQNGLWRVEVDRTNCTPTEYDEIIVDISSGITSNPLGPFSGAAGDCNPSFDLTSYLNALMAPNNSANYTYEFYDMSDGSLIPDPTNFTPTSSTSVYIKIIQGTCEGSEFIDFTVDCVPATCSLVLNSPAGTSSQSICINQAITNIEYTAGGDATNVTVTGLPTGLTGVYSSGTFTISGTPTQTGTFNYTVETVGCTTNIQLTGTIVINTEPVQPTITSVSPTCTSDGTSTISNYDGTLTYTFTPAGPTVGSGGLISGMTVGTSYTVVADNGSCSSIASANFSNAAMLASPAQPTIASVAPTCVADGSSSISNYNAGLTYTFTPAGPTVGAGGLISGMTVGTSYTVISNNGNCDSPASASFSNAVMLTIPVQPTITSVSPTCTSDGTSTISNYNAGLTYTFTPAGPTVGAGGLISGMTVGTSYTVVADNGSCSSIASANFSNAAMLASPAQPTIASVAPTCVADGSSSISNYNAGLTYTFTPVGPTVGAGGLISGMTVGTSYTVISNNGNCDSPASASFSNAVMLTTPIQPTIASVSPTCTSDGTSTISNYNAGLTYTFTPAGPTVGSGGLISGMTVGTSYTVVADNGSCSSIASANFSNAAMLASPAQPTIASVAPTCVADGSSSISNYNAVLTYTFTPAGPTVGAGGLISGMTVGTSYTVISNNGNCDSPASASFSNAVMLTTPVQPTIASVSPTCTSDGTSTISNYDGTLTYTFTPAGPTVGAGGLISGMTVGTSYTVVADNGSCSSIASANFSNAAMLASPAQPTIASVAPTCVADGSSSISNYNAGLTYTFTPVGPTVGAGGLISGMTVGTSYTVVSNNGNCDSPASASFSNAVMLTTPVQPTITSVSPTCTSDGTSTISNYNAGLTYTFTPAGPSVGAGGLVSGMTVGTSYTVVADNGSCSSIASANFSNAAMLASPAQPTIASVAPTCVADGSSSISNYNAGLTYTFTPAGPTVGAGGLISGMTVGTSYTVISNNGNCDSPASASFSNAVMLTTPVQPTIASVSPTCTSDGTSTISNYNAGLTYTFTPAGPSVGAGGLVSGMTVGTSYTVVADNGSCSSIASANFSNAAMLASPAQPTIASVAPTCVADGSSSISNYNAGLTYTFTPAGPTVGAGGLISGMTVGTSYTVISNNGNCDSPASASFSNAIMLTTPVQPIVVTTSPSCSDGTSTITNYNGSLTYTFTPAGPTVGTGGLVSGMTVGTSYTVVADNGSCISLASLPFVKLPSTPIPTVFITNNSPSICSGDSSNIILTSDVPGATFTWNAVGTNVSGSSSGSGTVIDQLLTATSNSVGEVVYTVIATANGCSSTRVEVTVYVIPTPDVTVSPTSDTICSGESTNITMNGSITGTIFNWTVTQVGVMGATSGTGTSIQQVLTTTSLTSPGTVTYTITPVLNGCSGTAVDVVVSVNPSPEIIGNPAHAPICSGDSTDINVSAVNPTTVFTYTVNAVGVTGASDGTITAGTPIAQLLNVLTPNVAGYVDYTITPTLNGCTGASIVVRVNVNPLPVPVLEDGAICVDSSGSTFQKYYFHTGLNNTTHTFVWYYEGTIIPGATSTSYEADQSGSYSVIATNIATGCPSQMVTATVIETNPATSFTTTVTNAFSDNATIVVNVPDGNGTLMYQIDDEELQLSNIFEGVSAGLHTITVVDTQGCTYLTEDVRVIDYPKYFTPNGDGFNDYWKIIGLQNQPGARLLIFDRYGKLIKQISTTGQGWDGTLNGKQLPSTDYWFTIEFEENGQQKTFRAHFSLIR